MAETGHSDKNLSLPPLDVSENKTDAWRKERHRLRLFIVDKMLSRMSQEDMLGFARATLNERYFWIKDSALVDAYEKEGGEWTTPMWDRYRV